MNIEKLTSLMKKVRDRRLSIDEAVEKLRDFPYEDINFARIDHHRSLRQGTPEVVFCQGKTTSQVAEIFTRLVNAHDKALGTRANLDQYQAVKKVVADAIYHENARIVIVDRTLKHESKEGILVVTAGTADIPVAEEAALTAEFMGNSVERLYDVGVAGIHRLLDNTSKLQKARVIVVVAGMEGALASVVGGLTSGPVIAVPTSIGYGASFNGLAALLSMLNSCSPNVAVVNIDNGFGAGHIASKINQI